VTDAQFPGGGGAERELIFGFEVLMAARMEVAVFWVVPPCLVEVNRRFRGPCFLHKGILMIKAESTSETSVNLYQTTRCYNLEDNHLYFIGFIVRTKRSS
jgi:hypothetical protein